jgi:hypothetical protein
MLRSLREQVAALEQELAQKEAADQEAGIWISKFQFGNVCSGQTSF